MKWNSQQTAAIDTVHRWLKDGYTDQQVLRMFGYAGTGKTTLARYLAEGVSNVRFAAYAGKAASVLQEKGCPCASTIHKLIYQPSSKSKIRLAEMQEELMHLCHEIEAEPEFHTDDKPEDKPSVDDWPEVVKLKTKIQEEEQNLKRPSFVLNPESVLKGADLLVIDEVSMVGAKIGEDVLSFGVPVLVLGDPAQLPPVKGCGYFINEKPDVMLTEIHRQAKGNPIIDMATKVRMGETLSPGQYGDSLVMDGKPDPAQVMDADQILVGTNITRRKVNNKVRRLLGHFDGSSMLPVQGDKLVCLRNDYDEGLLNGTLWDVTDNDGVGYLDRISLSIRSGKTKLTVDAHTHYFEDREKELAHYEIRDAQCFDYGYALTCHKSQGSQWDNVFVFDESHRFRASKKRWLYTAITRAAEKVTVCRGF